LFFTGEKMPRASIGRIAVAVLMGYVVYGIVVAVVEWLVLRHMLGAHFYAPDLVLHGLGAVVGGLVGSGFAAPSRWIGAAGMTVVGLIFKAIGLVVAWKLEPHWYGIALMVVYVPCVWIGWAIVERDAARAAPK
jgi:hypothetical protein